MITKRVVTGLINVLEFGTLQIREDTVIEDDGVEITRTYHRDVLEPGANLDGRSERIVRIANAIWTPEVIEARRIQLEKIYESMLPTHVPITEPEEKK